MGLRYNKEFIKKDGRKLISGGPRDLQRRQVQQSYDGVDEKTINTLTVEITKLRNELQQLKDKNSNLFTAEQIDIDVNKIVGETVEKLTVKHKNELEQQKIRTRELIDNKKELIVDLKSQNKFLTESICKLKDSDSSEITNKLTTLLTEVTEKMTLNVINKDTKIESDRPKMETVFIDPLESGAGNDLEPHINIEDVSVSQKEDIKEKVDKLRNLIGGLNT